MRASGFSGEKVEKGGNGQVLIISKHKST